jgi:hypothetical protein
MPNNLPTLYNSAIENSMVKSFSNLFRKFVEKL